MIETAHIIEYSDFSETRKVFLGDEVIDLPQPTEMNFALLIEEHNDLADKFNKLINKLKQNNE